MIYCFDLDGTLCNTEEGDYENSTPIKDRVSLVNKLYDAGNIIYIETARGSVTGKNWLIQTQTQLDSWGLKHHKLRVGIKFAADVFVDDKGMSDGDFFKE